MVDIAPLFKQQQRNGTLEAGGEDGFLDDTSSPDASFLYRERNQDIGHAILYHNYSIGYLVHVEAVRLGIQIASIVEDCIEMKLDLSGVTAAVETIRLPEGYHGLTEQEQALIKDDAELESVYRSKDSYLWPFIGFTYIIIRNEVPDDLEITCKDMKIMTEYMIWFYESDLVHEIAELHMFGLLARPVRDVLVEKLKKMTCEGQVMAAQDILRFYDEALHVEVRFTTTEVLETLLQSYAILYRAVDITFKAVANFEDSVKPNSDFNDQEEYRVLICPWNMELAVDKVGLSWIISGVVVKANLSGTEEFTLDIKYLQQILTGNLTNWNDPRLVESNAQLVDVNAQINVMVHPEIEEFLDEALKEYGGYDGQKTVGTRSARGVQYKLFAALREEEHTMIVIPAYNKEADYGATAKIVTSVTESGGVKPTRDSFMNCLSFFGKEKVFDSLRPSCYPLVFRISVIFPRRYSRENEERGSKAVRFWYWLLPQSAVQDIHWSVIHVWSELSVESERDEWERLLSIQYSDGTEMIQVDEEPFQSQTIVIAISSIVGVLVLVLLTLGALLYRSSKKLAKINVIQKTLSIDTESPAVKIMKFLEGIQEGRKLDKGYAKELLMMLRASKNLLTPDIQGQVRRFEDGLHGSQISRVGFMLSTSSPF
mmetsp:Transcript_17402/g.41614  ORF Transcript_17402/g.41614 Transcript_17402/m.41614 type:complete len:655 (+) Transcript_17402:1203-3167(+)